MFPPSVQEWLPENHLARFVVEVVSKLDLRPLFVQILVLAQAIGLLKLGRVSLDGTKVKANASKHSALSWGHIEKIEAQLRQEV